MIPFRVIPVIDILNSKAVHAIKGERTKYQPLRSKLFNSSNPYKIIKILHQNLYFNEFYIADLDSIIYKYSNFEILAKISDINEIKIILDPGIVDIKDISRYSHLNLHKLILGLETIKNLEVLKKIINILGSNQVIVSIDMFKGKIISKIKEINKQNPFNIIPILNNLKVKEIILLDLFRVGQKLGGVPPLYIKINKLFKNKVLVGGGIKNISDILEYYKNHFSGVLIATALYDGTIKIEEIRKILKKSII
ncbi:MAG: HisA/HisF-related TIM barrel protein [Promethearchaeota archaeon]